MPICIRCREKKGGGKAQRLNLFPKFTSSPPALKIICRKT